MNNCSKKMFLVIKSPWKCHKKDLLYVKDYLQQKEEEHVLLHVASS